MSAWAGRSAAGDFVGKRSLWLPDLKRQGSQTAGWAAARRSKDRAGGRCAGHCTSSATSADRGLAMATRRPGQATSLATSLRLTIAPTLGRGFALALVAAGGRASAGRLGVPTASRSGGGRGHRSGVPRQGSERTDAAGTPQAAGPCNRCCRRSDSPRRHAPGAIRSAGGAGTGDLRLVDSGRHRRGNCDRAGLGRAVADRALPLGDRADRAALWLGPDEWLVVAPDGEAVDLGALAMKAAATIRSSVVDVSHRSDAGNRRAAAAWCLNAFCALDLGPGAFPAGTCTRTLLGKAEILLWRMAPRSSTSRSPAPSSPMSGLAWRRPVGVHDA